MNQLFSRPNFISNAVLGMNGVITTDDELCIVQLNQNAELIFGYREVDLIGQSITQLIPETCEQNALLYSKTLHTRSVGCDQKFADHDNLAGRTAIGQTFSLNASIFSISYEGERYFTVLLHNRSGDAGDRDFTQLNSTADISLAECEYPAAIVSQQFNSARNSSKMSQIGIIEHQLKENTYNWSQEAYEILEIDPKHTNAQQALLSELIHPEDSHLVTSIRKKALETNSSYHVHHRLLMKDGRIKYVERRIDLFYDSSGLLERELELLKDISHEVEEEQKINETCDILRAMLDTTHVAIAQLDRDMNFVFVNKAYADTDNKTPEYFIGKNHFELFPHEENEAIFRNVVKTGEKYTTTAKPFEYEFNPERGVTHWDWILTPIKEPSGYVTGVVLSLLDVTERVNALGLANANKLKLRKLNERLEDLVKERTQQLEDEQTFINTVLETQGALILVLNQYGKIVLFNHACEMSTEYDRHEVIGKTYWEVLVSPDHRNKAIRHFERLVETGMPSQLEDHWTTKTGQTRVIDWSNSTIEDKEKNCIQYVVMTGLDVTERRLTEKLLKRTSDTLLVAEQITKIGSWEYDLISNKLWWSDEYYKIFDIDPKTHTPGKELYMDRIHAEDKIKAELASERLKTKGYKEGIHRIVISNNETRIISEIARAEYDKRGNPVLLKGTVQDITDITNAEMERNQLQRQLRQAHKMESIGQLTGGIAHDFNNILAAILGFTRLATMRFAPNKEGDLADYLGEIEKASQRASNLVKQMLAFSRGDTQDFTSIDPIPVVKESIKMLRSTIPSSVDLTDDLIDDNLLIESNSLQLQQAIVNLIVNARDAVKEKGKICISTHKAHINSSECISCHKVFSGDHFAISVEDTGGGIDPDIIANIFEPFFTTKPIGEGSGMGLAMVHGFLHASGGHILLNTKQGLTTKITLYFPVINNKKDITLDIETPDTDSVITNENKTNTILVVDDEPAVAKYMCDYLSMHKYNVGSTISSTDALEQISSSPSSIDLLITDQTMPELTGKELLDKVRKINSRLPVIIISGYSDLVDEYKSEADDNTFYLSKPIDQSALMKIINKVFNKSN